MCDAIPEFWKWLTVRKQHQVLRNINEIYRNLTSDEKVWTKHNVIFLLILYILKTFSYCVLVIFLQRRSHILLHGWKKISLTKQQRPQKTHRVLTTCVLGNQLSSRKGIIRKYMIHPRRRVFNHITNHIAKMNWKISNNNAKVSAHLNLEMSNTQEILLNTTPKDVMLWFITSDFKGKGAVHRICKTNYWLHRRKYQQLLKGAKPL